MTRALSLACLAFWALAAPALAGPAKRSIAVLGLEVTDANGAPTPADTQVAKELTEGLRSRALASTGPYQLQPGSEKELIDEKLLKNCDNEALGCMTQIANDLGAEVLMYGQIAKKSSATAYDVTITLLDVKTQKKKPYMGQIPTSQSQGAQIQGWAKKIYNSLTGQAEGGAVTVKLNVNDGGTILVDGHEKGTIVGGTGQAANIGPGKHQVTVQVGGYRDWSREINVTEGQPTTVSADLEKIESDCTGPGCTTSHPPPGGGGGGGGNSTMKAIAITGAVVGVAGGVAWVYGWYDGNKTENDLCDHGNLSGCSAKLPSYNQGEIDARNATERHDHTLTLVGGIITAAGAVTLAYSSYVLLKHGNNTEHAENGHRVHRDRFVVTPVVSPNGGGATLRIDF